MTTEDMIQGNQGTSFTNLRRNGYHLAYAWQIVKRSEGAHLQPGSRSSPTSRIRQTPKETSDKRNPAEAAN
jgi:hypothetical protein